MGKCPKCNKEYHLFKFFKRMNQWNEKPFTTCFDCKPPRKPASNSQHYYKGRKDDAQASSIFSSMGALSSEVTASSANRYTQGKNYVILNNLIFDNELGWQTARQMHHPHIRLRASTNEEDYKDLRSFPKIAPTYIDVVTDSGAQCCLWGLQPFTNVSVCDCPPKELPPTKLDQLPMSPIPENIEKFKEYLLARYASSTFNQCPHRTLPDMRGPPMKIHVDADAKPVAHTKPARYPYIIMIR